MPDMVRVGVIKSGGLADASVHTLPGLSPGAATLDGFYGVTPSARKPGPAIKETTMC